jgi:tetratricopeptide (TPR) repeat protein
MKTRIAMIGAAGVLVLAIGGASVWYALANRPIALEQMADDDEQLPVPPVPPRIAEDAEYDHCLAMLAPDPAGAALLAESLQAKGEGDGATQCLGLSQIALGSPDEGAETLDQLADASHAANLERATLYGQSAQAWLMAADASRAFDAASKALALSPDDIDLLIDRAIAANILERYQVAIDDLTRALGVDGRRPDALTLRATAWRHTGRLQLAEDDVDRALAIDPDDPEALLERGIIRQRRNDRTGARTDWQRAAELAPDTATADLAQQNLALLEAGPARQ